MQDITAETMQDETRYCLFIRSTLYTILRILLRMRKFSMIVKNTLILFNRPIEISTMVLGKPEAVEAYHGLSRVNVTTAPSCTTRFPK